jgi:hypothetical protein
MKEIVYASLKSFAIRLDKLNRQGSHSYSHRQIPLNESYSQLVKMAIKETREAEMRGQ